MSVNKVNLPVDARAMLKFRGYKKGLLVIVHKLADWFGFWRHPQDIRMDINSLKFIIYWVYKTIHPIVRAPKGTFLVAYFRSHREKPKKMLPEGFDVETQLCMSAAGDLMCSAGAQNSKNQIYADVADVIFDADIAFANLESTLTTLAIEEIALDCSSTPKINLSPAQYEALIQHNGRRYDIVQLANNHILDCGEDGVVTTLEKLEQDNVLSVGVNQTPEEKKKGVIMECNGIKIGWVAFTFSVNWKPFPRDKPYIVNMVPFHLQDNPDTTPILEQIRWCRDQACDLVVLCLHWGIEFEFFPHPHQLDWSHSFAEAGADVIIGHHPHVPQPMEFYRTQRDPNRIVPILYSLGNLTPVLSNAATVLSLIGRLKIVRGIHKDKQKTYVADVELIPTGIVSETVNGTYRLRLLKLTSLLNLALSQDMVRYVEEMSIYADLVLGKGWRID